MDEMKERARDVIREAEGDGIIGESLTQLTPRMISLIERKLKDRAKKATRAVELGRKHAKSRSKAKAKRSKDSRRKNRCK